MSFALFCSALGTPPWAFGFQLQPKSSAVVAAFEVSQQLLLEIHGCLCHLYGLRSTKLSREVRDNSGGLSYVERGSSLFCRWGRGYLEADREELIESARCVVGKQAISPSAGNIADLQGAHTTEFKHVPHQWT